MIVLRFYIELAASQTVPWGGRPQDMPAHRVGPRSRSRPGRMPRENMADADIRREGISVTNTGWSARSAVMSELCSRSVSVIRYLFQGFTVEFLA